MFTDLFEFQDIFASNVTTAVFVYATAVLVLANAALAFVLTFRRKKLQAPRILPRAI
jgi:hypothetical protein